MNRSAKRKAGNAASNTTKTVKTYRVEPHIYSKAQANALAHDTSLGRIIRDVLLVWATK